MPLATTDAPKLSAARVRKLIRDSGRSQAETARAAGIGEAELSRICARSMSPTPSQSRRLLEVLDPPTDGALSAPQKVKVSDV
jgi:transcriptional regulator with XRE-family HTH domain